MKAKIFDGIEVKGVPNSNFNTLIRTYKTSVVVQYELKDLNWLKYKNPQTNIVYIYDPDKRIAISYYDEDDEYISDLYGLSDWVKSLTEKKISMSLLRQNYQVIGL